MRAIRFDGQTHNFEKPSGVQDADCGPLPLRISNETPEDNMGLHFRSYWKPDAAELAKLKAGGAVELIVRGLGQPPVMLLVSDVKEIHDA